MDIVNGTSDLEKKFRVKAFINKLRYLQLKAQMEQMMDDMYSPFIIEKIRSGEYMGSYEYTQDEARNFWKKDLKPFQEQLEKEMNAKHRMMVYHNGVRGFQNPSQGAGNTSEG